jgi:hypothetical protein|tara:strand:- start:6501 stop:7751 length:1251 start_codon:yes stop_codon:yes gene_type:complete
MAITSLGNRLKDYQESAVLKRPAFRNRSMDAADARAPLGVLASSPELINAVVQNQMPSPVINTGFMGFDQQPDAGAVDPNAGKRGDRRRRREEKQEESIVTENPVVRQKKKPKFSGITDAEIIAESKAKAAAKKAKEKDPDKAPDDKRISKPDAALKNFTDRLSELRGTKTPRTKKDRLKEAKEFLKEAGVSDVDDIRTSKDFMLMTLGLNIAAGQSGDFLTNVATGAKETLGTFGELKAKEKEAERAVNLAAAEMAKADYDAAIARGAKLDEAELAMLTEQYKAALGPNDLQIARAVAEEQDMPLFDALKQVQAMKGSRSASASSQIVSRILSKYPDANPIFVAALRSTGGLKYVGENFDQTAIAQALGLPPDHPDVAMIMGIAQTPPEGGLGMQDETPQDSGSSDGITIERITD